MIKIPPLKKVNKFEVTSHAHVYDQFQLWSSQRKADVKILTRTFHLKPASGAISVERGAEILYFNCLELNCHKEEGWGIYYCCFYKGLSHISF